jgi:PAS domain S-box-containing protein
MPTPIQDPRSGADLPAEPPARASMADDVYLQQAIELVFRDGPFALALLDRDGRIVHANRAYERLFGWTLDELRRMRFLQSTHPDDREVGRAEVAALRRREVDSLVVEKRYVARDGHVLWANVTVFAVRDAAGRVVYTVAMVRDVTEERTAQRRALEWRRRYDTAILASRQVMYAWDVGSDATVWAGACEATLGLPASALESLDAAAWPIRSWTSCRSGGRTSVFGTIETARTP